MKNQKFRKVLLLTFFLLMPVLFNYFSPVLVIMGLAEGIIAASFITWTIMLVSSLVIGRAWCSYICPYGGLQMATDKIASRKLKQIKWLRVFKYILGLSWLVFIIYLFISKGSFNKIDYFYNTENIVSVDGIGGLIRYYIIMLSIFIFSLIFGKRSGCHYLCPMSILNIIGTKIKNLLRIPALRLKADKEKCIQCGRCSKACVMSLDVMKMVKEQNMENIECILCGECTAACNKGVIERKFTVYHKEF